MKICRDCKHIVTNETQINLSDKLYYAKCRLAAKINIVSGEEELGFCRVERSLGSQCGPDGALFEAQEGAAS
jgi:hypothetical protein